MNKNTITVIITLAVLTSIYVSILILPHMYGLFSLIYDILLPFLVSIVLTFILYPIVDKLERNKVNRGVAVFIVFASVFYVIVYGIITVSPMIVEQMDDLKVKLPILIEDLDKILNNISNDFTIGSTEISSETIADFILNNFITVNALVTNFLNILYESLGIIFLTPIITFYLVYDYHNIKRRIRSFFKKRNIDIISDFFEDIEKYIGAYFRGLVLVMIIVTTISSIIFALLGLKYPVLFGVAIGITNIIPIVGPYIGGAFAGIFALTDSFALFMSVVVTVVILQLVESNLLTPYVQSKTMKTHPLLILVAFLVFGKLFGFIGMVLSIPLLAVVILIIKYTKIIKNNQNFKSDKRP